MNLLQHIVKRLVAAHHLMQAPSVNRGKECSTIFLLLMPLLNIEYLGMNAPYKRFFSDIEGLRDLKRVCAEKTISRATFLPVSPAFHSGICGQ